MKNADLLQHLDQIGACIEARQWVKKHGGSFTTIWRDCERGDWMAWYISKNPKHNHSKEFYLALADCAALSLKYFERKYQNDKRPRNAIRTLRAYAYGKATREDLRAYYAAYAAYTYYAAFADYADDARSKTLKKCADIFRKYFASGNLKGNGNEFKNVR